MNIAVCIKQVPDAADLRLDPETNTLIREGVAAVLNPLDEFPLEAALRLRDALGGRVIAFSMGPPQARQVLVRAIAMGADEAVLVSDRKFAGADTWSTSLTLARALDHCGPFDLILCGKQAIDGDTAQVGPGIAAHLRIPQVTFVTKFGPYREGRLQVERMLEHGTAEINAALPAVMTVLKQANEPRVSTLTGRLRALDSEVTVLDAAALGLNAADVGLSGSPTRVTRIAVPESHRAHIRIAGSPEVCARRLMDELVRRGLVKN